MEPTTEKMSAADWLDRRINNYKVEIDVLQTNVEELDAKLQEAMALRDFMQSPERKDIIQEPTDIDRLKQLRKEVFVMGSDREDFKRRFPTIELFNCGTYSIVAVTRDTLRKECPIVWQPSDPLGIFQGTEA